MAKSKFDSAIVNIFKEIYGGGRIHHAKDSKLFKVFYSEEAGIDRMTGLKNLIYSETSLFSERKKRQKP